MSSFKIPAPFATTHVLALGLIVMTGGCASKSQPSYSQVGAPRIAQHVPAPIPAQVEVEDDGLPSQVPPVRRARAVVDDPSEPFSPNYGTRGHTVPAASPEPKPAVPVGKSPTRQVGLAPSPGYDSTFDANGVIARAIFEHEKRMN